MPKKSKNKKTVERQVNLALRKRGLTPEVKYYDFIQGPTNFSNTQGQSVSLAELIIQGSNYNQRLGMKINVVGVDVRVICDSINTGSVLPQNDMVRVIMYQDKQWNNLAAAPVIVGVANGTSQGVLVGTTGGTNPSAIVAMRNLNANDRYRFLYDQTKVIDQVVGGGTLASAFWSQARNVEFMIKKKFKKPIVIDYTANNGNTQDIISNNLLLGFISLNSTITTYSLQWRLLYTD